MAMLAEKKKREKWCLNPRGNLWSDDKSKFGQKLLEKMGWREGQGLGVNNQGPTEIVKVKKKDDNTGLGFKENGEEWLKTTSEFNELLDQLGNNMDSEEPANSTSSLENRSKRSKARVHYHKFTRGRDMSRYSEKDLASIIGPEAVKKCVGNIGSSSNQVNKGSYVQYFNSKRKSKDNPYDQTDQDNIEDTEAVGGKKKHNKCKKLKDHIETYFEDNLDPQEKCSSINKKNRNICNVGDRNQGEEYITINNTNKKTRLYKIKDISCTEVIENSTVFSEIHADEGRKNKSKQKKDLNQEENLLPSYYSINVNESQNKEDIKKVSKNEVNNYGNLTQATQIVNKETKYQYNENNMTENNSKKIKIHSKNIIEQMIKNSGTLDCISKKKKSKPLHEETTFSERENKSTFQDNKNNNKINTRHNHKVTSSTLFTEQFEQQPTKTAKSNRKLQREKLFIEDKNTETIEGESLDSEMIKKKIKMEKKLVCEFGNEEVQNYDLLESSEQFQKCSSNEMKDFLEVHGRRTCLRNFNNSRKTAKHKKYETQEFLPFTVTKPETNYSAFKTKKENTCKEEYTYKFPNSVMKILAVPNEHDCNIPKQVISYEYRLLSAKLRQLGLAMPEVKVVIQDSKLLSLASLRKLKTLHKSRKVKSLLPLSSLTELEVAVKQFSDKLQPKIDMMNTLVEMEKKSVQLAKELMEKQTIPQQMTQDETIPVGLNSDKVELLKNMSNKLQQFLGNKSAKTENTTGSEMKSGSPKAKGKKTSYEMEGEELSNDGHLEPKNGLQTRLENKIKILADEMENLVKGKIPPGVRMNKSTDQYDQDRAVQFVQGTHSFKQRSRGFQQGRVRNSFLPSRFTPYSGPVRDNFADQGEESKQFLNSVARNDGFNHQNVGQFRGRGGMQSFGRGSRRAVPLGGWGPLRYYTAPHSGETEGFQYEFRVRGGFRGRRGDPSSERRPLVRARGRISQNNFDAKEYVEKCKAANRVPEISFNGVDLKIISGYATSVNLKLLSQQTKMNEESFSKSTVNS